MLKSFTFRIPPADADIVHGEGDKIHQQDSRKHDNSCNQQTVVVVVEIVQIRRLCIHNFTSSTNTYVKLVAR